MLQVFLILYQELYYRHIYAQGTPNIEQRLGSFFNYCNLFNYILSKFLIISYLHNFVKFYFFVCYFVKFLTI